MLLELLMIERNAMDPITIILAVVSLGVGFGASTTITKRKMGTDQDAVDKELKKA